VLIRVSLVLDTVEQKTYYYAVMTCDKVFVSDHMNVVTVWVRAIRIKLNIT